MASADMAWDFARLDEVESDINKYESIYNQEIENLKKNVHQLGQHWISKETKTYETFENKFNEDYPILEQCDENLNTFRTVLAVAREYIENAAQNTNAGIRNS